MEIQQYAVLALPQMHSDRWRKGAPTEKLWELYQQLGSTHKVGEAVGMSFSAVHRRLTKAGHKLLGPAGESRDCAQCGKPFQATNCKDIYCGDDCAHDANNERQRHWHRARHPLSEKQCKNPECPLPDRKFMQKNDTREEYCSDECTAAANYIRNAETFKASAQRRNAKVQRCDAAEQQVLDLRAEVEELRALREAGILSPKKDLGGRPQGMTDDRQKKARELLRYIEEFIDRKGHDDGSIPHAAVKAYPSIARETAIERAKKTLKDYRKFKSVGGQKPLA